MDDITREIELLRKELSRLLIVLDYERRRLGFDAPSVRDLEEMRDSIIAKWNALKK